VYTWGKGAEGQLGLGDYSNSQSPKRVYTDLVKMVSDDCPFFSGNSLRWQPGLNLVCLYRNLGNFIVSEITAMGNWELATAWKIKTFPPG
jgi:hypothetical protein